MSGILLVGLCAVFAGFFVDTAATDFVRHSGAAWLPPLAMITDIGKSQWYLVPAGLVFIVLALRNWSAFGRRAKAQAVFVFGQAAYAFGAVAVSGLLVNVLKIVFGRGRPRLFEEHGAFFFDPFTTGYLHASFPSGHSTTVGAVAGVLLIWFPRAWPLLLACALVLGFSRVAAGAHYPSDVAAGLTLGFLYALFLARWLAKRGTVFLLSGQSLLPALRLSGSWKRRV